MARMSDFEYDVWQKKILARSARHKKNGSKSKKCTLPSDHMSKKEREAMNGEVKSLKLTEKYTYKEFKAFSDDMKKEYLDNLRVKYNVNLHEIQKALFPETNYSAFVNYAHAHGLSADFPRKIKKRTSEQDNAWNVFAHDIPVEPVDEPDTCKEPETVPDRFDPEKKGLSVTNLSGSFHGPCSVNDICHQLYKFLSICQDSTVSEFYFNIDFEKENENE